MITRKKFLLSAAALAGGAVATQAYEFRKGNDGYEASALRIREPMIVPSDNTPAFHRELVRYATLAPSSHNTQCWKFHLMANAISISPDFTRRCRAVDPDDHHLFVSLGCAVENLIQAAQANGLKGIPNFDSATDELLVRLEPAPAVVSPLFQAIPARQCTRSEYDGRPIGNEELIQLVRVGTGEGVHVHMLTEKSALDNVLDFIVAGNAAQMSDPAFVAELKAWIRFSGNEAVVTGDGLFSRTTGNPALPRWLGKMLFNSFYTLTSENEKYIKQMRSSMGVAVFVSDQNDKAHWIETGRCYERFALQATALGIRNAMVNQPVEVAALRPQLASYLGIGQQRPDLVVRFGRGAEMPLSMRRPVDAVLA